MANCQLYSVGNISRQENKESSKQLMEAIEKELDISTCRQFIVFIDVPIENAGYMGTTFADFP